MTVGERIKAARKSKNLTQKQLEKLCGINEANIRKYESGRQNPKIETLEKIASALDVPMSWFIPASPVDKEEYHRWLKQMKYLSICALLDQLNDAGTDMVRKYAEYLTKDKKYQSGVYKVSD